MWRLTYTKKLQSTKSLFGACFLEPLSKISSEFEMEVAEPLRLTMIGIKADLFKRSFQDAIRNSDLPVSEQAEIFKRVFQAEGSFPNVIVPQSPGTFQPQAIGVSPYPSFSAHLRYVRFILPSPACLISNPRPRHHLNFNLTPPDHILMDSRNNSLTLTLHINSLTTSSQINISSILQSSPLPPPLQAHRTPLLAWMIRFLCIGSILAHLSSLAKGLPVGTFAT